MPVQSLAADILKISMVKVAEYIKRMNFLDTGGGVARGKAKKSENIRMLLTIHDELLFEVKSDIIKKVKADIADIMENAFKLLVPLKVPVKTGKNWGQMGSD
jgi:DNA polymerase-1